MCSVSKVRWSACRGLLTYGPVLGWVLVHLLPILDALGLPVFPLATPLPDHCPPPRAAGRQGKLVFGHQLLQPWHVHRETRSSACPVFLQQGRPSFPSGGQRGASHTAQSRFPAGARMEVVVSLKPHASCNWTWLRFKPRYLNQEMELLTPVQNAPLLSMRVSTLLFFPGPFSQPLAPAWTDSPPPAFLATRRGSACSQEPRVPRLPYAHPFSHICPHVFSSGSTDSSSSSADEHKVSPRG